MSSMDLAWLIRLILVLIGGFQYFDHNVVQHTIHKFSKKTSKTQHPQRLKNNGLSLVYSYQ